MSNEQEIVNEQNVETVTAKKAKKVKVSAKKSKATKKTKKSKKSVKDLEKSMKSVEEATKKKTKKAKKKVAKSSKSVVQEVEQVASVENAEEVVPPEVPEDDSKLEANLKSIDDSLSNIQSHLELTLKNMSDSKLESKSVKSIHKSMRAINKFCSKISDELVSQSCRRYDEASKLLSKRHRVKKSKPNMNSGIQKPHPAHPKLAKFMGVEEGAPVSRVDALKAVAAYVKEHNLQTESDKRRFTVVNELKELFNVDEMGYTQIMGNLKPFFPPAEKGKKSS